MHIIIIHALEQACVIPLVSWKTDLPWTTGSLKRPAAQLHTAPQIVYATLTNGPEQISNAMHY